MLRYHVNRFTSVTSFAAVDRLLDSPQNRFYAVASDDERAIKAILRQESPPNQSGWLGWGSLNIGDIEAASEGRSTDLYFGADHLSESRNYTLGWLVGHEAGDLRIDGVDMSSDFQELGAYGATRLGRNLILDGALAYGYAEPSLRSGPLYGKYMAYRYTVRMGLKGDFGWQTSSMHVVPHLGALHAQERHRPFVDNLGNRVNTKFLSLSRLDAGARLTWDFAEDRTLSAQARFNLDSDNIDGPRELNFSTSLDGSVVFVIGGNAALEFRAGLDGLGNTDRHSSRSIGVDIRKEF